jgi:expansin (peptidoglycan-binding protein)
VLQQWWQRKRMWLIGTAGAVVAGTATVTLLAQTSGAACAAMAASHGQATFYAADGGGNCSFDKVSDPLVVALGNAEYKAGAACGGYLDVTGPKGTVRVKVTDRCPECAAGHLDLSRQAFTKIGNPVDGIISITYTPVVNPAVPGPMTVRVKEGSSRYWLALRVDNDGNPLTTVELQSGSGWKALTHTDYNYWIAQNGAGSGPFTVRVTDSTGRRTTLSHITLTPEAVQAPGSTSTKVTPTRAATPSPTKTGMPSASAVASPSTPGQESAGLESAGAPGPSLSPPPSSAAATRCR